MAGRSLSSCLAGRREGGRSDLEEAGRGETRDPAGAGASVVGTERGGKLSRHSCSPSKRHLWPGCPWRGDRGAEPPKRGAGAEGTCPGLLGRDCAPRGWRPLRLRHPGAVPKGSSAEREAVPASWLCPAHRSRLLVLFSSAVFGTRYRTCSGFVRLNPPRAELSPLCGVPRSGAGSARAAPTFPSHGLALGDVLRLCFEARIPPAPSRQVYLFPFLTSDMLTALPPPCCRRVPPGDGGRCPARVP